MGIKDLYNPKTVYEDYIEAYLIRPFVHHYADFRGKEPTGVALKTFGVWIVVTMGLAGILTGLVGLLGPEVGFGAMWIVGGIWIAGSLTPLAAAAVRASHGRGEQWKDEPRFLGIDALLTGICVLFFIFGILMMVTTLRSENLNPNENYDPETEAAIAERDSIWEEPIFTYQDATPAVVEDEEPQEAEEEELVSPEESFDPTIEAEDPVVSDTLTTAD